MPFDPRRIWRYSRAKILIGASRCGGYKGEIVGVGRKREGENRKKSKGREKIEKDDDRERGRGKTITTTKVMWAEANKQLRLVCYKVVVSFNNTAVTIVEYNVV